VKSVKSLISSPSGSWKIIPIVSSKPLSLFLQDDLTYDS
jgi:hypothetical protein